MLIPCNKGAFLGGVAVQLKKKVENANKVLG